jgi:hypothetical protein
MEHAEQYHPENSAHLLPISETIVRYAAGRISFEDYNQQLTSWWETHKEAWQENDLVPLFLLCCLNS